jgi:hypothetical protein
MNREDDLDEFELLAEQRFREQGDVDSVFSSSKHVKKPVKKVEVKEESDDDDDLADITLEVEVSEANAKIAKLKEEHAVWTTVQTKAIREKLDSKRLAKVSQKISSLYMEMIKLEDFVEKHGSKFKNSKKINELRQRIDQLELEKSGIVNQLETAYEELRAIDPTAREDDTDSRIVPSEDEDEEYERLHKMMNERRATLQSGNNDGLCKTGFGIVNYKNIC